MSPVVLFVVLVCGAFVAYGVKVSIEAFRLMRSGLWKEEREYDMIAAARYFRDIESECASLPDRTWVDLDLDIVNSRARVSGTHNLSQFYQSF
ncbi:MAG TPA: hypothetical protein VIJ90_01430 [Gemmatimonadaceae bacterium]